MYLISVTNQPKRLLPETVQTKVLPVIVLYPYHDKLVCHFRIKKGYPYEARVITRVLPTFLADFFPPQDIMNKIIGEFISSQQPYPQLIAMVVFQVL